MLSEKEAWREIGDAFEARSAHPDLPVDEFSGTDLAGSGLCHATGVLSDNHRITMQLERDMDRRTNAEVDGQTFDKPIMTSMLHPRPQEPGGVTVRATLAYLFAESAE